MKSENLYMLLYTALLFFCSLLTWLLLCDSLFTSAYFYVFFALTYLAEIITYILIKYRKINSVYLWILLCLLALNFICYILTGNKIIFYLFSITIFTSIQAVLNISRIKNINIELNNNNASNAVQQYRNYHILIKFSNIGVPLIALFYSNERITDYFLYTYPVIIILLLLYNIAAKYAIIFTTINIGWKHLQNDYKIFLVLMCFIKIIYPYILKSILSGTFIYNEYTLIRLILSTFVIYAGFKITDKNFIRTFFLFIGLFSCLFIFKTYFILYFLLLFSSVALITLDYFFEWYLASWNNSVISASNIKPEQNKSIIIRLLAGDISEIRIISLFIGMILSLSCYLFLEILKIDLRILSITAIFLLSATLFRYNLKSQKSSCIFGI